MYQKSCDTPNVTHCCLWSGVFIVESCLKFSSRFWDMWRFKLKLQNQSTVAGNLLIAACCESPELFPQSNLKSTSARHLHSTGSFSRQLSRTTKSTLQHSSKDSHLSWLGLNICTASVIKMSLNVTGSADAQNMKVWEEKRGCKILIHMTAGSSSYCWWACGSMSLIGPRCSEGNLHFKRNSSYNCDVSSTGGFLHQRWDMSKPWPEISVLQQRPTVPNTMQL